MDNQVPPASVAAIRSILLSQKDYIGSVAMDDGQPKSDDREALQRDR